jgi:hypothetical protein
MTAGRFILATNIIIQAQLDKLALTDYGVVKA